MRTEGTLRDLIAHLLHMYIYVCVYIHICICVCIHISVSRAFSLTEKGLLKAGLMRSKDYLVVVQGFLYLFGVWGLGFIQSQRVPSTYIVECRVSIMGITVMVWKYPPKKGT